MADNIAFLDLELFPTLDGYTLVLTTQLPCHAWMYYTTKPPEKQPRPIYKRGIYTSDALSYCFVAWHDNEQVEQGDTLIHTFIKEPWPI